MTNEELSELMGYTPPSEAQHKQAKQDSLDELASLPEHTRNLERVSRKLRIA